jgi:hypothetical protein
MFSTLILAAVMLPAEQGNSVLLRKTVRANSKEKYEFVIDASLKTQLPSGLGQDQSRLAISGSMVCDYGKSNLNGTSVTMLWYPSKASATGTVGGTLDERGFLKPGRNVGTVDQLGAFRWGKTGEKTVAELMASFITVPLPLWPAFSAARVEEGTEWKVAVPELTYSFVNATVTEVLPKTVKFEVRGSYSEDAIVQMFILRESGGIKSTEISKLNMEAEVDRATGELIQASGTIETRAEADTSEGFELTSTREVKFTFRQLKR